MPYTLLHLVVLHLLAMVGLTLAFAWQVMEENLVPRRKS